MITKYLFLLLPLFTACNILKNTASKDSTPQIEQALSACVTVVVEKNMDIGKVIMGFRGSISDVAYERSLRLTDALSSGSGFVIEHKGTPYIVTNAHVIESASLEKGSLFVYAFNRKKYEVKLVGGDTYFDIAVLAFVDPPEKDITRLSFSEALPKIAEPVYAIGNSLGKYPNTVTAGIVSALNRSKAGLTGKYGYIQSTATVIWGNSGGPLINKKLEVVGVNTKIGFAQGPDGKSYLQQQLNFSLEPIVAKQIVTDIITHGKKIRAYLGLELSYDYRLIRNFQGAQLGEPFYNYPMLTAIIEDSPVESILSDCLGDFLTAINNVPIHNLEDALGDFEKLKPNEDVVLTFYKKNENKTYSRSIKPTMLQGKHNGQIAKHVMNELFEVFIDEGSPQLKVYAISDSEITAYLLAAGQHSDQQTNLWRTTTEEDLGGVCRVFGLQGAIDIIYSFEPLLDSDLSKMTQHFTNKFNKSNKDNSWTTKLWY